MNSFIISALSGKDNASIDIGRVSWAMLAFSLVVFEGYSICILHQVFDPVQFSTGAAAILAAGGAALGFKGHTEPGT